MDGTPMGGGGYILGRIYSTGECRRDHLAWSWSKSIPYMIFIILNIIEKPKI